MNDLSIAPERGEINREFSQKEINEIVDGLINGSIQIEDVPSCVHSKLFTPLSLARNEAKLGNQVDKYNHLNNILWSLKLTLVQPDKSLMPQMVKTSTKDPKSANITISNQDFSYSSQYRDGFTKKKTEVSLVSAMKNEEDYSDEVAKRRLKGTINTTREFYENEEKHLKDMRDKEYQDLCKTHKMQPPPSDVNEAKRAEDEFELQLVDSRNKWNEKMKKLRENKEKEISEMETELSYYDRPPQKSYDFYDYSPTQDYLANTVEIQPNESNESNNTKKKSQSPKRMTQTIQPKKGQRVTNNKK